MNQRNANLFVTLSAIAALTATAVGCQIELGDAPSRPDAVGTFPGPDGPIRAMYRVQGDYAIVGGDMAFRMSDLVSLRSNIGPGARWPSGVLVYEIPAGFPNSALITEAVGVWNSVRDRTGVTLVARTNETAFVRFQNTDQGCYSFLGYQGNVQPINLGTGCGTVGTIVHELGHAIGLAHEQQRPDRDKYIKIVDSNIKPEWKSQVAIVQGATAHGTYDYDSVMHYPAFAASVSVDPSKPYMESLMPGVTTEMLGGDRLTTGDVAGVAAMYAGVGGGGGGGGGGDGGGGTCANACTDFGVGEGECKAFTTGNWQCNVGCLEKVETCEIDPNSCAYPCADYNVAEGECAMGQNGQAWECAGGCLGRIEGVCEGDTGGETGGGGGGGGGNVCEYTCSEYGYAEGQCSGEDGEAWECEDGCLNPVQSCGGTGGGNVGCSLPCSDYGLTDGQCQSFTNGDYQCIDSCMTPVSSCAGQQQECTFACEDYNYSEGQCASDENGAWMCTSGCLEQVAACS